MSTLSELVAKTRKGPEETRAPDHVVTLRPSAFKDSWQGAPREDVAVGLQRVSEADKLAARAQAETFAKEMHGSYEHQVEAFNDTLIAWCVACSLCDPNDVSRPYLPLQHDNLTLAFTTETVRFLWDELEELHRGSSAVTAEIERDELDALIGYLSLDDPFEALTPGKRTTVRKILTSVLDDIREAYGG